MDDVAVAAAHGVDFGPGASTTVSRQKSTTLSCIRGERALLKKMGGKQNLTDRKMFIFFFQKTLSQKHSRLFTTR